MRTLRESPPIGSANIAALRAAFIYLLFGALWIGFSDRALVLLFDNTSLVLTLQTVKGWLFVAVTGVLFFVLTRRELLGQQLIRRRDALTGLVNRWMLQDELRSQLSIANAERQSLSVFSIDIDEFKNVNTTFGSSTGDEVLRRFAVALDHAFESQSVVARIGAESELVGHGSRVS